MLGGELASARRGAGLIQHRRPLRRRLAEMNGVEPVVGALVLNAMYFGRIGKNAARAVAQHGVVFPASFPEFVDQLHIFIRDLVAVVMRGLLVLAGAAGSAVEIAGHHVPADPAFGQMIERRHPSGKRVRRLEGEIAGDAKTEILRYRRHRRDQHQRLVRRRLCGVAQRGVRAIAEHVVDAEHIGEKQPVEPATLQHPCQIEPIGQAVVAQGAVARMGPEPRRLMRHAVHGEGVEPDLFCHDANLGACRVPCAFARLDAGLLPEIVASSPLLARSHSAGHATSSGRIIPIGCAPQNWQTRKRNMADRADAIARVREHLNSGAFLAELGRRVSYRTESQNPGSGEALRAYLVEDLQPAFAALDFSTRLIESPTGRGPYLLADYREDASLPTVLTYGHGDVVDGMEGEWRDNLDPWKTTTKGERVYGRGTADNKG